MYRYPVTGPQTTEIRISLEGTRTPVLYRYVVWVNERTVPEAKMPLSIR